MGKRGERDDVGREMVIQKRDVIYERNIYI